VFKVSEGRPHGVDLMVNGEVQLLINTPLGKQRSRTTTTSAAGGDRQPRAVHHHALGGECGLRRHPVHARATAGGAVAAGVAGDARVSAPFIHESAYVDDGRDHRRGHADLALLPRDAGGRDRRALLAGQNVVVMNGTRIGNNVKIQNNVSVYEGWSSRTTCSAARRWCSRT
jgi:hypothetical protein